MHDSLANRRNAAGPVGAIQAVGPSAIQLRDNRPQSILQRKQVDALAGRTKNAVIQQKPNTTGLPDKLKSGIENLSGHSMDDVKVHYNSSQPAQLNAHAYAQGTDIHLAPGQEKHLPHEAWHVVQQKQGRVKPTMQMKGKVNINDDKGLEKEADVMGAKVIQRLGIPGTHANIYTGNYHDSGQLIPATGNNAPIIRENNTVSTLVTYQGLSKVTEGSTMKTYPLSARTSAGGSETTDAVRFVPRVASALYGKRYIAGHLLNSHLGGPGNNHRNITAFTSKSNSQHHAGIEKDLKLDVRNGYIAYYSVNCSDRAGNIPSGANGIAGLAKTMEASYSLLEAKQDVGDPSKYLTVRMLNLNLDPGGTGQTAIRDGTAIHDSEVLIDKMAKRFSAPASVVEFAKLLNTVIGSSVDDAISHILHCANNIINLQDRIEVQRFIEEDIRDL